MSFNLLPREILVEIIKYITNPDDIAALLVTNKTLREITITFTDRIDCVDMCSYYSVAMIKMFDNLKSCISAIRINEWQDLYDVTEHTNLTEGTLRIASSSDISLISCVNHLLNTNYLHSRRFKIIQYSQELGYPEVIWLGPVKDGILTADATDLYPFLFLCNNWIQHVYIDNIIFNKDRYINALASMPFLSEISYFDCGLDPCSAEHLFSMLIVNENIKKIECIPTGYIYDISYKTRLEGIDDFVDSIIGVYPLINSLILPFYFEDLDKIHYNFPNLKNVGIRCLYEFRLENYNILNETVYFDDLGEQDEDLLKLLTKYEELTIFLYIDPDSITGKQHASRHPEALSVTSKALKQRLLIDYTRIRVIDMINDPIDYHQVRDNMLFSN